MIFKRVLIGQWRHPVLSVKWIEHLVASAIFPGPYEYPATEHLRKSIDFW
eukprot:TRINITY_DN15772_c0_g1_i1.p2 TRINITY_DN15772_c0_g1~~TRINITY_DN15772_c0_g1_i1.p2  ORF type:complete len:50 (-),score=4.08 TRINITY_DN15772_c0_g1_i1:70-219(-)